MNDVGLVETVDYLGEGVVITVFRRANFGHDDVIAAACPSLLDGGRLVPVKTGEHHSETVCRIGRLTEGDRCLRR